ncbi:MAG: formylglycine-generating enzyme family protein [Sideroxydans sp.]|nr:formylglycine-generating enzyme family protein [Sideroxydans sp.]
MKHIFSALLSLFLLVSFSAHAGNAALRITCGGEDEGAEVYLNGKFKGECPVDIQIPEGRYKLKVVKAVDASHERAFEQALRLAEGTAKKIEVVLLERLTPAARAEEARRLAQFDADLASGRAAQECANCPEMVMVPAGSFNMGSPSSETGRDDNEGPVHSVNVKAFLLGKTHITRSQFAAFVNATNYDAGDKCWVYEGKWKEKTGYNWKNPGYSQQDDHPVACINWNDAKAYAEWLSRKTGKQYRLPTEAEWEYAARAGTTTARYWGDNPDQACSYANVGDQTQKSQVSGVTWDVHNCNDGYAYTAPVGSFKPNAFGLNDMQGNLWQWVQDSYHDNYNGAPGDGTEWQGDGAKRALRGSSWGGRPRGARVANRDGGSASRGNNIGFRLARTLP